MLQLLDCKSQTEPSAIVPSLPQPMNILAVKQEDTVVPVIKLIHFERARRIEPNSSLVVGRLEEHIEYEAPEILIGEPVTLATDMWSLGVVLYTL